MFQLQKQPQAFFSMCLVSMFIFETSCHVSLCQAKERCCVAVQVVAVNHILAWSIRWSWLGKSVFSIPWYERARQCFVVGAGVVVFRRC
jgi:hypothetical protein